MPREDGSILYCTTGILLQKMQTDPLMSGLTAIILDEIHERSVETDLLMGLLKIVIHFIRPLITYLHLISFVMLLYRYYPIVPI